MTTRTIEGQRFRSLGKERYRTLAGRVRPLEVWRSRCPECGGMFEFRTIPADERAFKPRRTCDACRKPAKRRVH